MKNKRNVIFAFIFFVSFQLYSAQKGIDQVRLNFTQEESEKRYPIPSDKKGIKKPPSKGSASTACLKENTLLSERSRTEGKKSVIDEKQYPVKPTKGNKHRVKRRKNTKEKEAAFRNFGYIAFQGGNLLNQNRSETVGTQRESSVVQGDCLSGQLNSSSNILKGYIPSKSRNTMEKEHNKPCSTDLSNQNSIQSGGDLSKHYDSCKDTLDDIKQQYLEQEGIEPSKATGIKLYKGDDQESCKVQSEIQKTKITDFFKPKK